MTAEFAPIPRHLIDMHYAGINRLRDQYPDALDAVGESMLVNVGAQLQVRAAAWDMSRQARERGECGRVVVDEQIPWAQVCVEMAGHPADEHMYVDVDVPGVPPVRVEPPTAADRRFNATHTDVAGVQVANGADGRPIWQGVA